MPGVRAHDQDGRSHPGVQHPPVQGPTRTPPSGVDPGQPVALLEGVDGVPHGGDRDDDPQVEGERDRSGPRVEGSTGQLPALAELVGVAVDQGEGDRLVQEAQQEDGRHRGAQQGVVVGACPATSRWPASQRGTQHRAISRSGPQEKIHRVCVGVAAPRPGFSRSPRTD